MQEYFIIGDIAARYDEFMALLAKAPKVDLIVAIGDLVDRGPKSREVIQWFIDNQDKALALYGNHEDLMVEGSTGYTNDWYRNGGGWTVKSYAPDIDNSLLSYTMIDPKHIDFLKSLPLYYTDDDIFVSHAPVTSMMEVPKDPYIRDTKAIRFIWNRNEPHKAMSKFVVNGHNGKMEEYTDRDGKVIGVCIDDSHNRRLCGLHWPSMDVYSVEENIPVFNPEGEKE